MFLTALERLEASIKGVIAYASTNDDIRSILGSAFGASTATAEIAKLRDILDKSPPSTQWKVMDHCAAVSRLYALYEQYAESVLIDWLSFRRSDLTFSELPLEMQIAYKLGFAEILSSLPDARYDHLTFDTMIGEFNKSIHGDNSYTLFPECLIHHRRNLRVPELSEIVRRCAAGDLEAWLGSNREIANHFETRSKLTELSASKMKDFVQYRNDAAHGGVAVDDILGLQQISDISAFILAFCRAFNQMIDHSAVKYMIDVGRAQNIGMVTEVFSNNIVVGVVEGAVLNVGDRIVTMTDRACDYHIISSLMIDDELVAHVEVAKDRQVGFGLSAPTTLRAKLITVSALVAL